MTTTSAGRWIYGGHRYPYTHSWPHCRFCGRAATRDCPPAACMLCGTVQCHGNSECKVCYHGYLPGWSRLSDARICGKKACEQDAVSKAPRVGQVCAEHATTTKVRIGSRSLTLAEYAAERVTDRDAGGT